MLFNIANTQVPIPNNSKGIVVILDGDTVCGVITGDEDTKMLNMHIITESFYADPDVFYIPIDDYIDWRNSSNKIHDYGINVNEADTDNIDMGILRKLFEV